MNKIIVVAVLFLVLVIRPAGPDSYSPATLSYTWGISSGAVDHYLIYLSIDDAKFKLIDRTTDENPFITFDVEVDGVFRIKVQAVDSVGSVSLVSESSDPVIVTEDDTVEILLQEFIDLGKAQLRAGVTLQALITESEAVLKKKSVSRQR